MNDNENHSERIAGLEANQRAFQSELVGIRQSMEVMQKGIDAIRDAVAAKSQTNWANIFAGLAVFLSMAGAFWIAGVNPLDKELLRHDVELREQAGVNGRYEHAIVDLTANQKVAMRDLEKMQEHGSANADKRLSILEYWMANQYKMKEQ
jgi:hypothetical protein